LLSKLYTVEFL